MAHPGFCASKMHKTSLALSGLPLRATNSGVDLFSSVLDEQLSGSYAELPASRVAATDIYDGLRSSRLWCTPCREENARKPDLLASQSAVIALKSLTEQIRQFQRGSGVFLGAPDALDAPPADERPSEEAEGASVCAAQLREEIARRERSCAHLQKSITECRRRTLEAQLCE